MTNKIDQQIDRVLGFVKAYGSLSDRLAADEVRDHLASRAGGEVEPAGWVWHSYNQTNFTSGSHHKEVLEADGVKLTPVYTHPAPAAKVPEVIINAYRSVVDDAYEYINSGALLESERQESIANIKAIDSWITAAPTPEGGE